MLTFTKRLVSLEQTPVLFDLSLTAEERTRSNYRFESLEGKPLFFRLPRGTVLQDGDLLQADTGEVIKIIAKPEPVFTVTAKSPLNLLKAAYHLGNRHVSLEITSTYLRLSPDPVLKTLLEQLGVDITEEVTPFYPETGAYNHPH